MSLRKPTVLVAGEWKTSWGDPRLLLGNLAVEILQARGQGPVCAFVRSGRVDLVALCDTPSLLPGEAMDLVLRIRRIVPDLPLVFLTCQSSEPLAIAALKAGVNDYLKDPVSGEALAQSVRRCLRLPSSASQHKYTATGRAQQEEARLIGHSPLIRQVRAEIMRIAASEANVLVTGETGTGKELAAHLIHGHSARRESPFVSINCAAIPETLLESELFGCESGAFTGALHSRHGTLELAQDGTLFLDEIGEFSVPAQAKILRAIELKEIQRLGRGRSVPLDFRVIAATNQDLERMIHEGKFRKDLYYRLDVIRLDLPPLREHCEDIPDLVDHFLSKLKGRPGRGVMSLSAEAMSGLRIHDWPGNVREVRNVLECASVNAVGDIIELSDLPESLRLRIARGRPPEGTERDLLISTLHSCNWNKSRAAAELRWSRMTLYRKIAKYRISGEPLQAPGSSLSPSEDACSSHVILPVTPK